MQEVKTKRSYCSQCSHLLVRQSIEGRDRQFCSRCETVFYENPLPVVSTILVNKNRELLLVKRGRDPYQGMWCLPIGFAESGEDIDAAALRELREEAGLEGAIARLIDVDTIDDDHYGSLTVITYEVRETGGRLSPGDDAVEAKFFPIDRIPPLAWESNAKAIERYRNLYRDTWAMVDSFSHLFPDSDSLDIRDLEPAVGGSFLSNVMVRSIKQNGDEITSLWMDDMEEKIVKTDRHRELFLNLHREALREVEALLAKEEEVFDSFFFFDAGRELKANGISMPSILTAMALSRGSIWNHARKQGVYQSPLDLFATLEINNRVIFLYDRINYHLAMGYSTVRDCSEENHRLNGPE